MIARIFHNRKCPLMKFRFMIWQITLLCEFWIIFKMLMVCYPLFDSALSQLQVHLWLVHVTLHLTLRTSFPNLLYNNIFFIYISFLFLFLNCISLWLLNQPRIINLCWIWLFWAEVFILVDCIVFLIHLVIVGVKNRGVPAILQFIFLFLLLQIGGDSWNPVRYIFNVEINNIIIEVWYIFNFLNDVFRIIHQCLKN